jgi:N-dimethylarginine dimethylaminohydrolase
MIYQTVADLNFRLSELPSLPYPLRVLMASPEHFDVTYVINAHMKGNIGEVNTDRTKKDWHAIQIAYRQCGIIVDEIPGIAGLPDMVFCANQTLPFLSADGTQKGVILSKMFAPQRADEVHYFRQHFEKRGYAIISDLAAGDLEFEGMGDALWHSGKRLLWGGYGFRTDKSVYDLISEKLDVPVILLDLEDPEFYHLDTCMCILDDDTVLIYPDAFTDEGQKLIRHFFPVVIEAPEIEARTLFACNAHCPDRKHVLIQRGCTQTNTLLRQHGFEVIELFTDEFLKSGGSVFCMKLMSW